MNIEYQTKNYKAKETLKGIVTKKLERLDKYFDDDIDVKVMMRVTNGLEVMEITFYLGSTIIRGEAKGVVGQTMYDLIDLVLPKIEKQIKKYNTIIASKSKKFRNKAVEETIKAEEKQTDEIVRTKSFTLTAMDEIEAMAELELLGHAFYVFQNKTTKKVNVLYKRNDGNYGLIEANV